MNELPIVYTLSEGELSRRRSDLLRTLPDRALSVENGYRFHFLPHDIPLGIAEVIRRERACCRLLRFDLAALRDAGTMPTAGGLSGTGEFFIRCSPIEAGNRHPSHNFR